MLKTFIEQDGGKTVLLNSLKRFVLSNTLVPSQRNSVVKVPAAIGTNFGTSLPIPLQGPQDAHSEVHSLSGIQGLSSYGAGTITVDAASVSVVGVGTQFMSTVLAGDTIIANGTAALQTVTVLSVQSDTALTLTVGPGQNVANSNYAIQTPIVAAAQNQLTCMIQDVSFQRFFMNSPVPVLHLFGDAQKPSMFTERMLLQPRMSLRYQFFNPSASAASIGFSMESRKWQIEATERYPEVQKLISSMIARETMLTPYWLTLDVQPGTIKTTIPANGTINAYMTNTGSNYLFLYYAYGHAVTAGVAGDTQEVFSFAIQDGKSGQPLSRQEATLNTGLGLAQNPYRFSTPLIVEPRNNIRIKLTNLITDQPTDVYMTFGGTAMLGPTTALTDPAMMQESERIYNAMSPLMEASAQDI